MRLRMRYTAESLLVLLSLSGAYISKPCLMFIPARCEETILNRFAADGWIVSYELDRGTQRVTGLVIRAWLPGRRGEDPNSLEGHIFSRGVSIPVDHVKDGARFVKRSGSNMCTIDGIAHEFYKPVTFWRCVVRK